MADARFVRVKVHCNPPTATHQAKKIVRAGGFNKLADKPELRDAISFLTALFKDQAPDTPLDGPIALRIVWCFPMPPSRPAKIRKRQVWWKTTKPDLSNMEKTLEDVLVRLGYMHDDNQICKKTTEKVECTNTSYIDIFLNEMVFEETIDETRQHIAQ